MRKDLNKLLCEHERYGSSNGFGQVRRAKNFSHAKGEDGENLPARESMKRRYQHYGMQKEFGENLNPLYGFVRKSVGKVWDKSYSELCSVFDMGSVINRHILQHLFDMFEKDTFEDDDGVVCYRDYKGRAVSVKDEFGPQYYVHPRTGVLLENTKHTSYRTRNRLQRVQSEVEERKQLRIISPTLHLRKREDGNVWFICELAEIPPFDILRGQNAFGVMIETQTVAYRFDLWDHTTISRSGYSHRARYGRRARGLGSMYVAKVRTASHKELKQYGII